MSVTRRISLLVTMSVLFMVVSLWIAGPARAAIIISEVDPSGSTAGLNGYQNDWFELTNTGAAAVDITGWQMDDNSYGSAKVPLRGVTSINAGQSVIFIEGSADGSGDAALWANFESFWFGSNVPAGFTIGGYGGGGVGLSTGADAVNIYDAGGTQVVGVSFGSSTSGVSFDNAAGLGGAGPYTVGSPAPVISTLSVVGANGAFSSFGTGAVSGVSEIGSPGVIAGPVQTPEPSSLVLAGIGGLLACATRMRRRK